MMNPKGARNKAVVILKKADPEFFSFAVLANLFKVKRDFVHRVFHRDKDKYHLNSETPVIAVK
jgi:hypothetical protein